MPLTFEPVNRPEPKPDLSLDTELEKAAEDAQLTLYFINMVVVSAKDIHNADSVFDKSDPYCEVAVGELTDKTSVIENDLTPVWNEKMNFFVAKRPDTMTLTIYDYDEFGKNDVCGTHVFHFEQMFETGASFEGDLPLAFEGKEHKGTIQIALKCKMMKPIEMEIKYNTTQKQLENKEEERAATVVALDESEELRKEAIAELSAAEQEVMKKAEELVEKQKEHEGVLSEKEQQLVDQASAIEDKVQQIEEAKIALQEEELKKQAAEAKLTEAEQEILRKAEELEEKERTNAEALTSMEKEILSAAEKLEEKEKDAQAIQLKLQQTEALKLEVQNELTTIEKMILEQANELEEKKKQYGEELSAKEKEILSKKKELEEKDALAKQAQEQQDSLSSKLAQKEKELQDMSASLDSLQHDLSKVSDQVTQVTVASKEKDEVIQTSKKRHDVLLAELENTKKELSAVKKELSMKEDELDDAKGTLEELSKNPCNQGCSVM